MRMLALLVVAQVVVGTVATAQGSGDAPPSQAPTLHYENGRIVEEYLPFSRRFAITGALATSQGVADVVLVRIGELGRSDRTRRRAALATAPVPFDSSCWVRPPGDAAAQRFSVTVRPLALERRYRVDFTFAREYAPAIVQRATERATAEAARPTAEAVSEEAVGATFVAALERELRSATGIRPKWLRVVAEGTCTITDTPPAVRLPPAELAGVSREISAAATAREDRETARAARGQFLRALDRIPDAQVDTLAARLLRALRRNAGVKRPYAYDTATVAGLRQAYRRRDAASLPAAAWGDLNGVLLAGQARAPLTSADLDVLTDLLGAINGLREKGEDVATAEAELRESEAEATAATAKLRAILDRTYTPIAQVGEERTSWGAETEVRKLRIGTGVGGAYALMSLGRDADDDGMMFATLRYYLDPVDRSLPEPWSTPRARWSIDVGAVFQSTLRYRGQKQKEAFGGLSPMLGLTYDLQRYLALSGGLVVFRQPSVNPANKGERENLHSAPYFGLSVDVDALNTLRSLIKPGG